MRALAVLFLVFLVVAQTLPARSDEQILSFAANITIQSDSSLLVEETIIVRAEGREIRRGIYRDIPLRTRDDNGLWRQNGFTIESVLHNGADATYRTEWVGRFLRIYIGDADIFIPAGRHEYAITYRTTRQLRYFEEYDELYWNVTGNFWAFPILDASAIVRLPDGAEAERIAAYTGRFGESGTDYAVTGEGSQIVQFFATRPLPAGEGLTIAVGFPKGAVQPETDTLFDLLRANLGFAIFAMGWFCVVVYFVYMWWRVGRDPPGETVIPLFHPPDNLSPAAMSYVHFKSFRNIRRGTDMAFIAALLSLGVKRRLVIEEEAGETVFVRGLKSTKGLFHGERAMLERLFSNSDRVELRKKNGPTLAAARSRLHDAINREYGGKFFRHNFGWFVPGAAIAGFVTIFFLARQEAPEDLVAVLIPLIFLAVAGSIASVLGWGKWTGPARTPIGMFFGSILLLVGAALLILGVLLAGFGFDIPLYRFASMTVFFGILLIVAMFFLLAAPTLRGAKVLSRIEGFKLYLETAEANRLNMRDAPEMTEELYEAYLPYAAGLGVEKPWSDAYSAHLSRIAPDAARSYEPHWYRGRDFSGGSLAEATSASMASVSSAMASSMPQPKSSSGSSGGGFSGGGGGGGGGGGW